MEEGVRRICDFDNDSFETLIHLYQPYLVKNLKVYDLVMSSYMMIPGRAVDKVMTLERNSQTEAAAGVFLEALLESEDPSKWSAFRDALNKPEHALIVDIFERGVTEDLKIHDELQNVVDLFRKDIVEALDPFSMCQYLLQAELLSLAEAQKVQACQRQDGDNMANFLLMSYVPRNKDWYLKFMKIIWAQGQVELVRLIDPEMFDKLSAQEVTPACEPAGEGVHLNMEESGETSVKLLAAPPRTSTVSGLVGGDCLPANLNDFQEHGRKSYNFHSEIFKDKTSTSREKRLNTDTSAEEIKEYNIPVTAFRGLSVDSNESEIMDSMDENISAHSYYGVGIHRFSPGSKVPILNHLSPKQATSEKVVVAGGDDANGDGGGAAACEYSYNGVKSYQPAVTTNVRTSKLHAVTEEEQFPPTGLKTSKDHSSIAANYSQEGHRPTTGQGQSLSPTRTVTIQDEVARRLGAAEEKLPRKSNNEEMQDETFVKPLNISIPMHGRPTDWPTQRSTNGSKNESNEDDNEEVPAELVEQLLSIPDIDAPPQRSKPAQQSARSEPPRQRSQQPAARGGGRPKQNPKPRPEGPRASKLKPPEPIKGGMSDGYTIDVACLADDDMAMHGAMLSNAASWNKKPGEGKQQDCIIS